MEYELVVARSQAAENAALSSKVLAQNAKVEKLKAKMIELPGLKKKLAKYKELFERLAIAER